MPDMYTKLCSHSPLPNVFTLEQWSAGEELDSFFDEKVFQPLTDFSQGNFINFETICCSFVLCYSCM